MERSAEAATAALFDHLRAEGFDACATLPLSEAGDPRYAEWIELGYHGGLAYLERHAPIKADPAAHFQDYRTLVVVLLEYGQSLPSQDDPRVGNISRYALGDDYHEVLKQKLLRATERIRALEPSWRCRAFVDTGPLNEKSIAAKAGLGWQGKNTNLIDPRRGSYFFLGLLLVSADLKRVGQSQKDRCGQCTACIPACPTGAIVAPYVLDARRCISWLTIEQRGPIPPEFREAIGARIFGCDDCQEVCPWNRFAKRHPPPELSPRKELRERRLSDWLALDQAEWKSIFARSAVLRAGYEGFLRNVLIAAGNSRDPEGIAQIANHLASESTLLRSHAAWALGRIGGASAEAALAARSAVERDAAVGAEIAEALARLHDARR